MSTYLQTHNSEHGSDQSLYSILGNLERREIQAHQAVDQNNLLYIHPAA